MINPFGIAFWNWDIGHRERANYRYARPIYILTALSAALWTDLVTIPDNVDSASDILGPDVPRVLDDLSVFLWTEHILMSTLVLDFALRLAWLESLA